MNKYLSTFAAMAGASVLSLCASSAYYSSRLDAQAYRARVELLRARQEQRVKIVERGPSYSIGLVCIIADTNQDGVPEMRFLTPDGQQVLIEREIEPVQKRLYFESF